MTARFSRAAQQSVEFARKARGHRPRLQLTEYRLNLNSSALSTTGLGIEEHLSRSHLGVQQVQRTRFAQLQCETVIVSGPERQGEFFNLVRKQTRSYLGDARNPQFGGAGRSDLTETPVDSC